MKDPYPVSVALRQAIDALFADPSVAYGALGVDRHALEDAGDDVDVSQLTPLVRIDHIRRELEVYIVSMAAESTEMGSPEATETLRMQAIGVLLALRQIFLYFPDARG